MYAGLDEGHKWLSCLYLCIICDVCIQKSLCSMPLYSASIDLLRNCVKYTHDEQPVSTSLRHSLLPLQHTLVPSMSELTELSSSIEIHAPVTQHELSLFLIQSLTWWSPTYIQLARHSYIPADTYIYLRWYCNNMGSYMQCVVANMTGVDTEGRFRR